MMNGDVTGSIAAPRRWAGWIPVGADVTGSVVTMHRCVG